MFPNMLVHFEEKLKNIKASVQELEDFLPIMKEEYAKQQGIIQEHESENDAGKAGPVSSPNQPSFAHGHPLSSQPPLKEPVVITLSDSEEVPSTMNVSSIDELEVRQQVVETMPESVGPEAGEPVQTKEPSRNHSRFIAPLTSPAKGGLGFQQRVADSGPKDVTPRAEGTARAEAVGRNPRIDQVPRQKRKSDISFDDRSVPDSKRGPLRNVLEKWIGFSIFNFRQSGYLTPALIAVTLPRVGTKGQILPSDIEILNPQYFPSFLSGNVHKCCASFKIRGPMAEELRNWINGPTYAEDNHHENAKIHAYPDVDGLYLLDTTDRQVISLFALLFLTAQEIREAMRIDVKLAPEHLELLDENGKRKVLTIAELLRSNWISLIKKASMKMTRSGKAAVSRQLRRLGYPEDILKAT